MSILRAIHRALGRPTSVEYGLLTTVACVVVYLVMRFFGW